MRMIANHRSITLPEYSRAGYQEIIHDGHTNAMQAVIEMKHYKYKRYKMGVY